MKIIVKKEIGLIDTYQSGNFYPRFTLDVAILLNTLVFSNKFITPILTMANSPQYKARL